MKEFWRGEEDEVVVGLVLVDFCVVEMIYKHLFYFN